MRATCGGWCSCDRLRRLDAHGRHLWRLGAHLRKSGTSRSSSSSKTTDERRVLEVSGIQGAPVPGPARLGPGEGSAASAAAESAARGAGTPETVLGSDGPASPADDW